MESGHVFIIVIAALITGSITLSTFAQAWATSRKHRAGEASDSRLDVIEARLARMEEAIESVAVEMERIAEGQRFTAKLLTDRGAAMRHDVERQQAEQDERPRTIPY